VGTAYIALFNLAFVRQQGGRLVLRIEDTDRARYDATSEQQLYDGLRWLGLDWDEGPDKGGPVAPYRQSERLDRYTPIAEELLSNGHAYHCWCTPQRLAEMRAEQQRLKRPTGYDRLCLGKSRDERSVLPGFSESPVVRMRVPATPPLHWVDLIRGDTHAPHPDDQVLVKADGFPTYHLANVVDDHDMGITHVVRGEEWISSTPKHLLLYDWQGWQRPQFAHMPLLRNPDKSKISKRKNPAARLTWFIDEGFLPEALRNFLALMGYSQPDGVEVFGFDQMVAEFAWSRVNPVGPVFDIDKLRWLSGHYLRDLPVDDVADRLVAFMTRDGRVLTDDAVFVVRRATPLVQERVATLGEAAGMVEFLLSDPLAIAPETAAQHLGPDQRPVVEAALAALEGLEDWTTQEIEAALRAALVDGLKLKPKHAFGPVRVAVTGSTVSPPLFESIELLGRDRTVRRLGEVVREGIG
jgi:glutamyl-tRNA synthetase